MAQAFCSYNRNYSARTLYMGFKCNWKIIRHQTLFCVFSAQVLVPMINVTKTHGFLWVTVILEPLVFSSDIPPCTTWWCRSYTTILAQKHFCNYEPSKLAMSFKQNDWDTCPPPFTVCIIHGVMVPFASSEFIIRLFLLLPLISTVYSGFTNNTVATPYAAAI